MNPEKVSVGPFHLLKASSRKYGMQCRAAEPRPSGNFCRSSTSLSPLYLHGWGKWGGQNAPFCITFFLIMMQPSFRFPGLTSLCVMEWKVGEGGPGFVS